MATLCANVNCVAHTEDRGGRKVFNKADGQWYCDGCFQVQIVGNEGKDLWNFTTTHFTGEKTHVKSLGHLRQLEKQYGCSNQLANNYERNCR
jgi:hypothetical protein